MFAGTQHPCISLRAPWFTIEIQILCWGQKDNSTTYPNPRGQKQFKIFLVALSVSFCRQYLEYQRKIFLVLIVNYNHRNKHKNSTTTLQYHHTFFQILEICFCDWNSSDLIDFLSKMASTRNKRAQKKTKKKLYQVKNAVRRKKNKKGKKFRKEKKVRFFLSNYTYFRKLVIHVEAYDVMQQKIYSEQFFPIGNINNTNTTETNFGLHVCACVYKCGLIKNMNLCCPLFTFSARSPASRNDFFFFFLWRAALALR